MSVRSYNWAASSSSRRRNHAPWSAIPVIAALATVGLQIAYPLTHDDARTTLTVITVVTFFLASATHALVWRGLSWTAGYLVIAVGGGLAVEAIGSSHGVPFGSYDYTDSLGTKVFGVPWVIPLAWAMMAYPALIVARRLAHRRIAVALIGGLALASWDLFLDPMMVGDGHWVWGSTTPSLPGIDGIPLTNFVGWFVVAVAMIAVLDLLPRTPADDRVPLGLWLWTYVSSVVANLVFLDRASVAVVGGIVMGIVALPLMYRLAIDRA